MESLKDVSSDVDDVNTICNNLKKLENLKRVTRIENFDDTITD